MRTELKSILSEYMQRRQYEEKRINILLKKFMNENPAFAKARQEYSAARAGHALAKLKQQTVDIEKAKAAYHSALKSACKKSGVNTDDIEMKYRCSDCMDTGYVGENEKTFCHCLVNKVVQATLYNQNLLDGATFGNFDAGIFPDKEKVDKQGRTQRQHALYIKERAEKWCSDFPGTKKHQTLFIGATGVGKSYMTNCIAHEIIKKGYSVVSTTANGINEAKLKVINEKDNSLIVLMKSADLLIIDDLGVESAIRNITVETLYEIIEYRISNKKHTIICTNLTLPMIEKKYGVRLFSRISSAKNTAVTHMLGEDLRRL